MKITIRPGDLVMAKEGCEPSDFGLPGPFRVLYVVDAGASYIGEDKIFRVANQTQLLIGVPYGKEEHGYYDDFSYPYFWDADRFYKVQEATITKYVAV